MKKILSLFVLFSCGLACADAYEKLKAAQAKFHGLIYQGGALPDVAGSAPEVAYVAGFFYPPITLPADQESNEIYRALINKGTNKDPRHGSGGVDGSNLQQFNALDLSALGRYNEYASNDSPNRQSVTGHSVLGIAAQHPRMVIAAPPPPIVAAVASSPAVSSNSSSSGAAAKAPAMTMAGGGFPFGRPAQKAAVPDTSVPGFEAVGVKLNEINSKLRKFKNDEADTRILKELQGELSGISKAGIAVQQARFEKLVIAFNYINKQEEGDHLTALRKELVPDVYAVAAASAPAVLAAAPAVKPSMMEQLKLAQELRKSQQNDALTASAIATLDQSRVAKENPVEAAIELCVSGNTVAVPSAISDNQAAVKTAIDRLKALGDSATKPQKDILRILERRFYSMSADSDDEGSDDEGSDDDEFGPVRKNLSITSTPSPVPAQAAVTNAPVTVPTPVGASTLVNATNASKKSPQPTGFVPDAFKGFLPPPPAGAGGGVVKKAVAAPPPTPMPVISSSSASAVSGGGGSEKAVAAPPPQPQPIMAATVDGELPPIDAWAEQEFERRKAEIESKIKVLNDEDTSQLSVFQRRARGQAITNELKPLEAELARYNNSYAKGSIIAEIKRGYPR